MHNFIGRWGTVTMVPERCEPNAKRLVRRMGVNEDEAYAMMLLTAVLMDLDPNDDAVIEMILRDSGY